MKKTLLLLFLMISVVATAQTTQDSIKTKTVYAQLLGINKNVLGLGSKVTVEIDFGDPKAWYGRDGRDEIVDENGKEIKFNSMVDAMNYMGERGWTYEDSYVITIGSQNVIHWLLSKEIPIDGDSREGVRQKRDMKKKKNKKPKGDNLDDIYM